MLSHVGRFMWYDRIPTAAEKATQRAYAAWLQQLPLQIYLTLTFAHRVSQMQGVAIFDEFINRLERYYRAPIGWIRCEAVTNWSGCGLAAVPLHFHILLCSAAKLDLAMIEDVWHSLGHFRVNAEARVYDAAGNAAVYCMKFLHEPGLKWDIGNLHFYVTGTTRTNHRGRRQRLRQQVRETAAVNSRGRS